MKMAMDAEDAFADVKKVMDFKDKAEEDAKERYETYRKMAEGSVV